METEIQQADEFQGKIFEALVQINRALTQATVTLTATPTIACAVTAPTDQAGTEPEDRSGTCSHGAKVKLPKLSLPRFNGDLMKWPIFWDSYESAIHNNDQLTEFNSLLLRSLLECMALDAISGLTLSAVRELSGSG